MTRLCLLSERRLPDTTEPTRSVSHPTINLCSDGPLGDLAFSSPARVRYSVELTIAPARRLWCHDDIGHQGTV